MEQGPKLIRRDGIFYVIYEGETIPVEEWEAMAILQNHALVYDVIVSYKRKFQFNTTQDSPDFV